MRDLFATWTRPFYQFGGFFELGPIGDEAWRDGLARVYAGDKTEITDAALDMVLATSARRPPGHHAGHPAGPRGRRRAGALPVDATEVRQGIDYAMAAESPAHQGEVGAHP